jgi:hypothetical protein
VFSFAVGYPSWPYSSNDFNDVKRSRGKGELRGEMVKEKVWFSNSVYDFVLPFSPFIPIFPERFFPV